jgi:hypothetical protein
MSKEQYRKSALASLIRANNSTAQALREFEHTETQDQKDFSEVLRQIEEAESALRDAKAEIEHNL